MIIFSMSLAYFLAMLLSLDSTIILIFASVPDGLTNTLPTVISDSISFKKDFTSLSLITSLFETSTELLIWGILTKFDKTSEGFLSRINKDEITLSAAIVPSPVLTKSLQMICPEVSPPRIHPFFDNIWLTYLSPISVLTNL